MPTNEKPEEIVKKECINRLDQWLRWGIVVDYDDVSGLGKHMNMFTGRWTMHTKEGKRDLIVWFKVGKMLWTYLIECKAPDGGHWDIKQQEFAKKFEGLENVIYEVIKNADQIDATLDRISKRTDDLFNDIDLHMGLKTLPVQEEIF